MNTQKILNQAQKMAAKAKPGHLKIDVKTYTFEFDKTRWLYNVYEDMELLMSYNTKSLKTAKEWLREYLEN